MDKLFSEENKIMTIGAIVVLLFVVAIIGWYLLKKSPAKVIQQQQDYAEPIAHQSPNVDEDGEDNEEYTGFGEEPGAYTDDGPGAEF